MEVKIKYFSKEIQQVEKIAKGDWIDLRSAADLTMKAGDFAYIPLGVGMILPEGYEAQIAPRSSTFKNFGIIVPNSPGIVDNSFCGEEDQWRLPAYALRDTEIRVNDRICQFRLAKRQPDVTFVEVDHLSEESRGGFGSTGKR